MRKRGAETFRRVLAACLLLPLAVAAGPGQELAARLGLDPAVASRIAAVECSRRFRGLSVRLLQGRDDAGNTCYAWAGLFKNGRLVADVRPSPIRAGKGPWGLFLPVKQPSPEVFLLQERGAGGDRVHVMRSDGVVLSLPGREAVVSPDGALLAVFTPGRTGALALFDLAAGQEIYRNDSAEPGIFAWYARGGALVGSVVQPTARGFGESPLFYYLVDPARGQFKLLDGTLPDAASMKRLDPIAFASSDACRCAP